MASARDAKIAVVMGEFKRGTLKSSSGKKVTDRKQALAIANSEGNKLMSKKPGKGSPAKKKKQGYTAKLHESLGARNRKTKGKLGVRSRESEGMEKKLGRRKFAAVKTMDKGRRKRKA